MFALSPITWSTFFVIEGEIAALKVERIELCEKGYANSNTLYFRYICPLLSQTKPRSLSEKSHTLPLKGQEK